jgi:hypothetical protein
MQCAKPIAVPSIQMKFLLQNDAAETKCALKRQKGAFMTWAGIF